jgi:hypothetical protein
VEQQTLFPSANRRVLIGSVTKQATTGRICVPIRMPLTGEALLGCPEWVSTAYDAVEKYLTEATPEIEQIADITVAFSNQKPKGKLFDDPNAKIPSAELRAFCIQRCGDEENPDVELAFKLYAPFSRDFWKWLGEMCGAEVYMAFPKSLGAGMAKAAAKQDSLDLSKPSAAEKEALAGDANPPVDAPKKKSSPKELLEFHKKVTPGRGKTAVQ